MDPQNDVLPAPEVSVQITPPHAASPTPPLSASVTRSPHREEADPAVPLDQVLPTQEVNRESTPELDPDLLNALGEEIDDNPIYGPNIHSKLAQRWLPILKKVLNSETKEKLEYTCYI